MEKLIRNRRIADDSWRLLERSAAGATPVLPAQLPTDGDLIVPLSLWRGQREALAARAGRSAVWLDAGEGPEAIAGDLAALPLVAVNFPVFGDGRGFSTARLLRERYGYRGEVRAIGDVLRDQLLFMARCGFDSFALRPDQDVEGALRAFDELPDTYQASVVEPLPLFRRRLASA